MRLKTVKRMLPAPVERPVRAVLTTYRVARGPSLGRGHALSQEVDFWERWLDREGNLERRLDRALTEPALVECLARIPETQVSIIDVGAGPLTTLGAEFPGKQLSVTAVDPLADEYDRILHEAGITPPVRTLRCSGEGLLERFEPETFDIAFSANALDHTVDPFPIIENMLSLAKPGRFVVLNHFRNEAETASYGQLHQWNFDEQDGRCIVWRDGREPVDVGTRLSGRATVTCRTDWIDGEEKPRVVCLIEKHQAAGE